MRSRHGSTARSGRSIQSLGPVDQPSLLSPQFRLPLAIAGGILVATSLWALAASLVDSGHESLASVLYWQDTWLHSVALSRQGSPDDPSPAFYRLLNLPVGVLAYGSAIYLGLFAAGRLRKSRSR